MPERNPSSRPQLAPAILAWRSDPSVASTRALCELLTGWAPPSLVTAFGGAAANAFPESVDVLAAIAKMFLASGLEDRARELLLAGGELDPNHPELVEVWREIDRPPADLTVRVPRPPRLPIEPVETAPASAPPADTKAIDDGWDDFTPIRERASLDPATIAPPLPADEFAALIMASAPPTGRPAPLVSHVAAIERVPSLSVLPQEVAKLKLDRNSGRVLALVDGVASFRRIVEESGVPHDEALRILIDFSRREVIRFGR